jgi:release factor glutamine methyltransferase
MAVAERTLDLTRKAAAVLAERDFESPRLDAELLLAAVLGMGRLDLYLQHDRPVSPEELERFRAMVRRRLRHEPVQYIVGRAAFRRLELQVDRRVLIPRPETEMLVGAVLEWGAIRGGGNSVLDVGTGSGAIALSLAQEGSFRHIVASDVCADALDVARCNAERSGLAERVEFRHGSLFDVVQPGEQFNSIVSNPLYVADAEAAGLMPEVRDWEPARALFAGDRGLAVIASLVAEAPHWLEPGGLLAVEIGATQADAARDCAERAGVYADVRVLPDLAGRPRVLLMEHRSPRRPAVEGKQ